MPELNNTVYLLVGTRAAGKSTALKSLRRAKPSYHIISRDQILDRFYGGTMQSAYGGGHYFAAMLIVQLLGKRLTRTNQNIVLDVWNAHFNERRGLIDLAREKGADRVVAIVFTTPLETVETWFWQKPGIAKSSTRPRLDSGEDKTVYYSDSAPRRDYEMYQDLALGIETNGFDEVIPFNPLEQSLEDII